MRSIIRKGVNTGISEVTTAMVESGLFITGRRKIQGVTTKMTRDTGHLLRFLGVVEGRADHGVEGGVEEVAQQEEQEEVDYQGKESAGG